MFFLCTFDSSGIQQYIFGSNALKDNIGASRLVARATGDCLLDAIRSVVGKDWVNPDAESFFATDSTCAAFLVFSAGGNAQVVFRNAQEADEVLGELSRQVLMQAPGLRLLGTVSEWPDGQAYEAANATALQALDSMKSGGEGAQPDPMFNVAERCEVSGASASVRLSARDGRIQWVSRSIATRREVGETALNAFDDLSPRSRGRARDVGQKFDLLGLEWTNQLDLIRGRKGEKSYLAVIHMDANGMGDVFRQAAKDSGPREGVLRRLGTLSEAVDRAVVESVLDGIEWLLSGVAPPAKGDAGGRLLFGEVPLHPTETGKFAFPLRPIVVAGDDTTLVAEGSMALDLAARMTSSLASRLSKISGIATAGACVGVGFGKAHSPFWRLYELAAECCRTAKAAASIHASSSYMDWAFLEEEGLRRALLRTARPYRVDEPGAGWPRFRAQVLSSLHNLAEKNRGQIKSLATDLASGSDEAVVRRLNRWKQRKLPELPLQSIQAFTDDVYGKNTYFSGDGQSALLDGISLLDFSLALPSDCSQHGEGGDKP